MTRAYAGYLRGRTVLRKGNARRLAAAPIALVLAAASCTPGWHGEERDFRQEMRDFVRGISEYARLEVPAFVVIPQNGHEIISSTGEPDGGPESTYLAAIDGAGREDLFYGYDGDDVVTPAAERDRMAAFMDLALANGLRPLVTDYCSTPAKIDDSYALNEAAGYLSFAAPSRELDVVPDYPALPHDANSADIADLAEAENFLYLLNPDSAAYPTKASYLAAVAATDYDVLIMDLFYEDAEGHTVELGVDDLAPLAHKANGGSRLLICYMSIGEAENYRFYWNPAWERSPPSWLAGENPSWPGNFKVEYWEPAWQAIIYGGEEAYLDRILAAGFDGVYLDIIDAYEYFEEAAGTWDGHR